MVKLIIIPKSGNSHSPLRFSALKNCTKDTKKPIGAIKKLRKNPDMG